MIIFYTPLLPSPSFSKDNSYSSSSYQKIVLLHNVYVPPTSILRLLSPILHYSLYKYYLFFGHSLIKFDSYSSYLLDILSVRVLTFSDYLYTKTILIPLLDHLNHTLSYFFCSLLPLLVCHQLTSSCFPPTILVNLRSLLPLTFLPHTHTHTHTQIRRHLGW